jgi:transcriptional regulator with XRE-family HTH domain
MNHRLLDPDRLDAVMSDWARQCGKRLRARRQELNWSQEQLANLTGVRGASLCRFELGVNVPKDSVRVALAYALMCEVSDLYPPLDRALVHAHVRDAA